MNWKRLKLSEVCTLQNGRAYKKAELLSEGKYPVLRVGNLFTSNRWYYSNLDLDKNKYCKNGDLLYAWSASFGAHIWQGEKSIYHYHIWRVDINEKLIDKKFLYYWFEFDKGNLKKESGTGTTMMHVSKGSMDKREISVPSLLEQQRIVTKLDAVSTEIDRGINQTQKLIENSNLLFEEKIKQYFVNNITNSPIVKLSDISEYFNGLTYSPKDVSEEGVIVLRSGNIQNGKMKYLDIKRVNKKIKDKLYVKPNDILICSRNGSQRLIGKSSLIGEIKEPMTFGTFMMILRSEHNEYLQWFIKSKLFKKQILKGESTMINQITRYMLDDISLPFPDKKNYTKIAKELGELDGHIRMLNKILNIKIDNFKALKSSILQQELLDKVA